MILLVIVAQREKGARGHTKSRASTFYWLADLHSYAEDYDAVSLLIESHS